MRISGRRLLVAVVGMVCGVTLLGVGPANADETTGPWPRGSNDGKTLCGWSTVGPSPWARARTERKNVDNGCWGGLTGSESIYATTSLFVLTWAFTWERCGYDFDSKLDDDVVITVTNQNDCPRAGFTFRAATTHGGHIGATWYTTSHWPLLSPTYQVPA